MAEITFEYEFADARSVRLEVGELLRPARRISIPDFARESLWIETPGGVAGLWSSDLTPYMVRPMEMLKSRRHEALIFVGPARTGKTVGLVDCWIGHTVCCDPGDMLVMQMTQDLARDYSNKRLQRLHENSPELGAQLRMGTHDDTVHDKRYVSGMHLVIGWPSPAQVSGRDFKYVAITDYDRMPDHIGREGSPFGAARKRTQTFMSGGMTAVESSPGRDILPEDDGRRSSLHELPPAPGICSLYNLGTREILYFQCPSCRRWFIPDFPEAFSWPESRDIEESAGGTQFCCTQCGELHPADRHDDFIQGAAWIGDGQHRDEEGRLRGSARDAVIASFRMPAGAAAYQHPQSLTRNWLSALRTFETTGDEEALRSTVGLDQGKPYRPRSIARRHTADELAQRSEPAELDVIPEQVRFLTATVDVQQFYFAVLILGWGPDRERWVIDRFDIRQSNRLIDNDQYDVLHPAEYVEDWDVLIPQVINRRYQLPDGSGRTMGIKVTGCDSGGEKGVAERAYAFYQRVKALHLQDRFALVKGDPRRGVPRVRKTFPDSTRRKDRQANAKGEIPVWQLNVQVLKDGLSNDLAREASGPGCIHFSDRLPDFFFEEMAAEIKDARKGWIKRGKRNESWILMVYARGLAIAIGEETVDWSNPKQRWAMPWDRNSLVRGKKPGEATRPTPPAKRKKRPRVRTLSKGIRGV